MRIATARIDAGRTRGRRGQDTVQAQDVHRGAAGRADPVSARAAGGGGRRAWDVRHRAARDKYPARCHSGDPEYGRNPIPANLEDPVNAA
jgi:hypothetical protein